MPGDADKKSEEMNLEIRRSLASAYGFVQGQQSVQSFAALTLEELYDQQIERIEGADSENRPNELHRVDKLEQDLLRAVEKIKSLPANAFIEHNESTDVNTDPNVPEE